MVSTLVVAVLDALHFHVLAPSGSVVPATTATEPSERPVKAGRSALLSTDRVRLVEIYAFRASRFTIELPVVGAVAVSGAMKTRFDGATCLVTES